MKSNDGTIRRSVRALLLTAMLAALLLILAACQPSTNDDATAESSATEAPSAEMPAPTEPPAEEAAPTEEATTEPPTESRVASLEHTPDPMLINITWEWLRRDPNGNQIEAIDVADPADYTLLFNEDGTFSAKLDCNNASGVYATSGVENAYRSIFMELGPAQLAFCGDDSLDTQMAQMFGPVQNYQFEDDGQTLVFSWVAGGPIDYFQVASEGDAGDDAGTGQGANPDPVAEGSDAVVVELPAPEAEAPTGRVIAEAGVNVRMGPGLDYAIVGTAPQGTEGQIIGVSEDGAWWVASVPSAPEEQGWVAAVNVEAANADDVPVIPTPPLTEANAAPQPGTGGVPDELDTASLLIFSASRVAQDGNASGVQQDVYIVEPAASAASTLLIENALQPALQPDGAILAFRSTQTDRLGLGGYDFNSDERVRYSGFAEDSRPRWSPTGDRMVFSSDREGDRAWRLYITEPIAGQGTSDFSASELGFGKDADWHPTEETIVFKGCDESGNNCGLWTIKTDGAERSPLSDGPNDSLPRWSPNGEFVVFMSDQRDGNWELYRLAVGDGTITRLTENEANDGLPAWSPDGQQIAFVSNRDGAWGIWTMGALGGDAQMITALDAEQPDWLIHSIDWKPAGQ